MESLEFGIRRYSRMYFSRGYYPCWLKDCNPTHDELVLELASSRQKRVDVIVIYDNLMSKYYITVNICNNTQISKDHYYTLESTYETSEKVARSIISLYETMDLYTDNKILYPHDHVGYNSWPTMCRIKCYALSDNNDVVTNLDSFREIIEKELNLKNKIGYIDEILALLYIERYNIIKNMQYSALIEYPKISIHKIYDLIENR